MRKRKPCLPISNSWEEYKKRKSRKKRLLYIQELICISALVYLYNRSAIRLRAYVTFLFFLFQSLLNIHCTYIYIYIYFFFVCFVIHLLWETSAWWCSACGGAYDGASGGGGGGGASSAACVVLTLDTVQSAPRWRGVGTASRGCLMDGK